MFIQLLNMLERYYVYLHDKLLQFCASSWLITKIKKYFCL